jgi:hypothetical protein
VSTGHTLVKCWSNRSTRRRRALVKYWSNTGQIGAHGGGEGRGRVGRVTHSSGRMTMSFMTMPLMAASVMIVSMKASSVMAESVSTGLTELCACARKRELHPLWPALSEHHQYLNSI